MWYIVTLLVGAAIGMAGLLIWLLWGEKDWDDNDYK